MAHLSDLISASALVLRSSATRRSAATIHQLPMMQPLFEQQDPAPVKAALAMMGLMRDELRAPMEPATASIKERLADQLKRLDCW